MKTILLAAVVSSSISPTASAINVQNELNNYSNSLNDSNYFIESNSQTFQKIVNNKEKLFELSNEIKNEFSSGKNKISKKTEMNIQDLSNLIFSNVKNSRWWTQWWGANLWINFTLKETQAYLTLLSKFKDFSNKFKNFSDFLNSVFDGSTTLVDATSGTSLEYFAQALSVILYIASGIFNIINEFSNYSYVKSLADKGRGVVSLKLLFGFIPLGLQPGYKVR